MTTSRCCPVCFQQGHRCLCGKDIPDRETGECSRTQLVSMLAAANGLLVLVQQKAKVGKDLAYEDRVDIDNYLRHVPKKVSESDLVDGRFDKSWLE